LIKTPNCSAGCGCFGTDVDFKIANMEDGTEVGNIKKQWKGWSKYFYAVDTFVIDFPEGVDVTVKATLLGNQCNYS